MKGGEKMKKDFYINEIEEIINFLYNIDYKESEISDYNVKVIIITIEKLKRLQGFLGKGDRD